MRKSIRPVASIAASPASGQRAIVAASRVETTAGDRGSVRRWENTQRAQTITTSVDLHADHQAQSPA